MQLWVTSVYLELPPQALILVLHMRNKEKQIQWTSAVSYDKWTHNHFTMLFSGDLDN